MDAVRPEHAWKGGLKVVLESGEIDGGALAEAAKSTAERRREDHANHFLDDVSSQVFLVILGKLIARGLLGKRWGEA